MGPVGRRAWCGEENADKISKPAVQPACGAIAQLGERIVRNDEVVGSIPTSSTKFWLNVFSSRKNLIAHVILIGWITTEVVALVEATGIEPATSSLRTMRSPS